MSAEFYTLKGEEEKKMFAEAFCHKIVMEESSGGSC